jgi:hypothetical protein
LNPFDYLTVLVSIVLGLAIANVLSGLAGLMHARERIAFYWPPVVWAVWLFFIAVQHWWAEWGVHNTREWTFGAFLLSMLVPVDFFLLSSLVLPPPGSDAKIDLYAWYARNRQWFFGLLTCLPLLSILEELVRSGRMASQLNFYFLLAFAAMALVAAFLKSRRANEWITAQAMVLTGVYVALLYLHLSS